jgi:hypothetical protein
MLILLGNVANVEFHIVYTAPFSYRIDVTLQYIKDFNR